VLVDLMMVDNDPRLAQYFGKAPNGSFVGFDARTNSPNDVSPIAGSGRTDNPTFAQPLVTWAENQLILAEATFALSGAAAAQPFLDAVRASIGKPAKPATLRSIMEEKYMLLYQNVEAWNDYKRTCIPTLVPAAAAFTAVPGRFLYGETEFQTNSANLPTEGALQTFRNANDPNAC